MAASGQEAPFVRAPVYSYDFQRAVDSDVAEHVLIDDHLEVAWSCLAARHKLVTLSPRRTGRDRGTADERNTQQSTLIAESYQCMQV